MNKLCFIMFKKKKAGEMILSLNVQHILTTAED